MKIPTENSLNWKVNDKVICVDNLGADYLKIGQLYCIQEVVEITQGTSIIDTMVSLIGAPKGEVYISNGFRSVAFMRGYYAKIH